MASITQIAIIQLTPNTDLSSLSTTKATLLANPKCTTVRHARQLDAPDNLVLFVDWDDSDPTSPQTRQQQNTACQTYLSEALSQQPRAAIYHVSLTPPLSTSGTRTLLDAPVTEVVRLYFPADLSDQKQGEIYAQVAACAESYLVPHAAGHVGKPSFGFALDLVDELPPLLEAEGADTKDKEKEKVLVLFVLAGWESRAAWTAWAGSEAARDGIALMKGLPGLKGQELFLVGRAESVG